MSLLSATLETCYEPLPAPDDPAAREFAPELFERWVALVAERGAGGMLTALVLKLERLARTRLDLRSRLWVLMRLLPAVHDLADGLPAPSARAHGAGDPQGLSLEQRLWCLVYRILAQMLEWVDGPDGGDLRDRDLVRLWLVSGLFEALGRLMDLGRGVGTPPGSWQQAHDLYVYYLGRVQGSSEGLLPDGQLLQALDPRALPPDAAYRRLLIYAMIRAAGRQDLIGLGLRDPALAAWAGEAELHDPGSYFGVLGTYLVELSADAPPRRVPGALGEVSRSLVLEPPADLLERIRARYGPES
jgi:hypothetical protein